MFIGFAIHWWGTDPDFQAVVMWPYNFILAGTGLKVDLQHEVITLPLEKGHWR